jgi:hypothetical protein
MKRHLLVLSTLLVGAWSAAAQDQIQRQSPDQNQSQPQVQNEGRPQARNQSRGQGQNELQPQAQKQWQPQGGIDPHAQEVLRSACQFLAQTPHFGLTAEIWREHVEPDGDKVQFTREVNMEVKRPNSLHVDIHSSYTDRGFWYQGHELAVLDRKKNFFSTTPMPPNIDEMLNAAHDQFAIDLPLVDLAVSDPYDNAIQRVQTGRYLGLSSAMGYTCHHLAFTQENIDWQVWIQDGPQPLIRKFVITHKLEPGQPEFTALIRGWDMLDRISNSEFAFEPPRGAVRVQMLRDRSGGGNGGSEPMGSSGPGPNAPTGR